MLETHGVGGGGVESSAGKETHPSPAPIFFSHSHTSPALNRLG